MVEFDPIFTDHEVLQRACQPISLKEVGPGAASYQVEQVFGVSRHFGEVPSMFIVLL